MILFPGVHREREGDLLVISAGLGANGGIREQRAVKISERQHVEIREQQPVEISERQHV